MRLEVATTCPKYHISRKTEQRNRIELVYGKLQIFTLKKTRTRSAVLELHRHVGRSTLACRDDANSIGTKRDIYKLQ
jgi:hypothetical protein